MLLAHPTSPFVWLTERFRALEVLVPTDADTPLIERARAGDPEAFEALYRRHVDFVWTRLTRLVGLDADREDLVQHVFVGVFQGLAAFRGEAKFRTYLYRLVANVAADHLERARRRPRTVPLDEIVDPPDARASQEERLMRRREIERIWACLDVLPTDKRIAFVLRRVEGLSLEEIGCIVDASVQTVWARVEAAERELVRRIRDEITPRSKA